MSATKIKNARLGWTVETIPKKYDLLSEERETVVTYNDKDKDCVIFTCNKALQRELQKKGYTILDQSESKESITFTAPKKMISFRTVSIVETKPKPKSTRKLTEEQKLKMQEGRKRFLEEQGEDNKPVLFEV